ncbi:MAG: phosphoribosylamine--glycine ligase [Myxococcales bacterium]|nr:phosphoribosylamine--glycine ligase [Myxococcales bacterium]
MRILVLGSGGREHALAWRAAHEGHEIHVAPGSDGIAADARCHPLALADHAAVVALARGLAPDLVIVGPEQPLVEGLADRLRAAPLAVFGPSEAAAELEGSKAAAKAFMVRHGVPTARHVRADELAAGLAAVRTFAAPPVIKASGLAAGKGVTVADSFEEAELAVRSCLEDQVFGRAGDSVVLEERLEGAEASLFVVTDGERYLCLPPAQDHKRLLAGDRGPNTGGMGAYSPAPICSDAVLRRVAAEIVEPTLAGLRAEGRPFVGALFVGLMIDAAGVPRVIEYNCRFGDPEIQPVLFGLQAPIFPHLLAAAHGRLQPPARPLPALAAATVVLAAGGYPGACTPGAAIRGLELAQELPDVKVFHAGTRRGADGWVTNGGRVLGVCARGPDLPAALVRAYAAVDRIDVAGGQHRRDIGARA